MATWDARMLRQCAEVATWSKDRTRKVGAVITTTDHAIVSTGCNGFPRGADDDNEERHARPAKYLWTEHAERNAIYNAGRHGIVLQGCTMYVLLYPCIDCARGIVQSGIARLVTPIVNWNDEAPWFQHWRSVQQMLRECGVRHDEVAGAVDAPPFVPTAPIAASTDAMITRVVGHARALSAALEAEGVIAPSPRLQL